jgi:hypothetical protein
MQAMICSPHYYRRQMEVKEDLSDIWKEEDPDYKFLNYTHEKMGRQAEKGMSVAFFFMMFCLVAWKRVPLTARPMTVAKLNSYPRYVSNLSVGKNSQISTHHVFKHR